MNLSEVTLAVLGFGVGGAAGAIAALVAAGQRMERAFRTFLDELEAFARRQPGDGARLLEAFAGLRREFEALAGALERLRRALRLRSNPRP